MQNIKDKHLIFITTYAGPSVEENGKQVYWTAPGTLESVLLFFQNFLPIIRQRTDAVAVVIDNGSGQELTDYLRTIAGQNIILQLRPDNVGRPRAVNEYIAQNISAANLPRSVWALDPDLLFDSLSFDLLADAVAALPQLGLIGMRYKKNICNPELRTYLPAKTLVGMNGRSFSLIFPLMANVAGPIMAMTGRRLMETLKFKFFPFKDYHCYGHCDAVIYDFFKRRGIRSGYLNGTLATHLKSGPRQAAELIAFIQQRRDNPGR